MTLTARARHANARKTRCPQGHPYDPQNTIRYRGSRYCRACHAEANRRWRANRRRRIRTGTDQ